MSSVSQWYNNDEAAKRYQRRAASDHLNLFERLEVADDLLPDAFPIVTRAVRRPAPVLSKRQRTILEFLSSTTSFATTADVRSIRSDLTYQATYKFLCRLEDGGLVERRKINAKSNAWSITQSGRDMVALKWAGIVCAYCGESATGVPWHSDKKFCSTKCAGAQKQIDATDHAREAARSEGEKLYWGSPCKHDHKSKRYVACGGCVECHNIAAKNWHGKNPDWSSSYYMENRESILLYQKSYYVENIEYHIARAKDYRDIPENREARRIQSSIWHFENYQAAQEYRQDNSEKYAAHARNRRARIAGNGGTHTIEDIHDIMKAQNGKCAYCRIKVGNSFHVDHIMPIYMGGSNGRANLQICCEACNLKKNKKHPLDFARQMGKLL